MNNKMVVEVFCVHQEQSKDIHKSNFTGLEVGKVDNVKTDTWVLAIILLCVALVLLTVGVMKVVCQNKKTKMREQLVMSMKETKTDSHSSKDGESVEWSIKL